MRLGRLVLTVGVALLLFALTGAPVIAVPGNGSGQGQGNGQGAERANGRSVHGVDAVSSSPDTGATTNSSTQVCDGDSGGNSDTGHGANQGDVYDNTCPNGESGNGNGGGQSNGQPCAGCVGQADDKNPPGQMPGPQDHNNGYECDGNNGIGRTNPAHTGCPQTPPPPPQLGYTASVAELPCGSTSLLVSMSNLNNAAGGSRTFLINLDGVTVDTVTLASGASGTSAVTIPSDGDTHTVSVATGGNVVDSGTAKVETVCEQVGAAAAIADLACNDETADITVNNTNASAARTFTASLDGVSAGSVTVAAGQSGSLTVTIPKDNATHSVAVASGGTTHVTKALKYSTCPTTRVLGVQFARPLGAALPRTGAPAESLMVFALAMIGLGMAIQVTRTAPVATHRNR